MNMNHIINMVIRRVMSIAINKGINAGVDQVAKRKKRGNTNPRQYADLQQVSKACAKQHACHVILPSFKPF